MKLYIWSDPYDIPFGMTMVIAVAESVGEARKQAATGKAYAFGNMRDDRPTVKLGKPTRVVSLPCAEWHMWSE